MYRRLLRYLKKSYFRGINLLHLPLVKRGTDDPYHAAFEEFVELVASYDSPVMLEIGSRNVTGSTYKQRFPNCSEYKGFDVIGGEGVDIKGDIHRLSEYVPADHFDFVLGISVFEHLLFPWKAAIEINKVLKVGGCVYLSTHPVWPEHELPWDFWRFPQNGFHALFNEFTGFEVVTLTEGLPCKTYSLVDDPPTRNNFLGTTNQAVALMARKAGPYRSDLIKWDIDVSDVLESAYPGGEGHTEIDS